MRKVMQEIEVYQYSELSETAKDKVKDNFSDSGIEAEYIIEDWKEKLQTLGYDSSTIFYRGFYSQGDGACFEAYIDNEILVKRWEDEAGKQFKHEAIRSLFLEQVTSRIYNNNSNYCHERTKYFEAEIYGAMGFSRIDKTLEESAENFTTWAEQDRLDLCREIYKSLEASYDYNQSDEAMTELCTSNEWEFLSDGSLYIN